MHLNSSRGWENTSPRAAAAGHNSSASDAQPGDKLQVLPELPSSAIKYRVLVADDHPLFREALVECVRRTIPIIEILVAWDLQTLQAAITSSTEIDLLLLDLNMPGVHGLSALVHARALAPGIAVITVSDVDNNALVQRAIGLGAAGFIAKSSSMSAIGKAFSTVLAGGISIPEGDSKQRHQAYGLSAAEINAARRVGLLTPQQYRIATLLGRGLHDRQISWELGITEATVKVHISSILQAMRVRNRTQVALLIQLLDFEGSNHLPGCCHECGTS